MAYPKYGTHPIKCAKKKCKWQGYEGELAKIPATISGVDVQQSVCPECGCDTYRFLTGKEIAAFKCRQVED